MTGDAGELERLRARIAELEAHNKLLRAAIEASPTGIVVATAPEGTIRVWNSAGLGTRGGDPEALTDIPIELYPNRWQTFGPDGTLYAPSELPLARALLTGEIVEGEELIVRREDGEERWVAVNAAPVRDDDGRIIAGVAVFPDVTARKAAEAELARFRTMAEVSPDFIGFATPAGTTLYVNPGGRALCGIGPEVELAGAPVDRYHAPDTVAQLFEVALPTALETGVWQGESVLLGPSGERIPVSQLILAHRESSGEVAYVSTVMRDLRMVKELEAKLHHSQRLESIGRLAGGIAHDFNNMLLVIDNYVQFVLETLDDDDERHQDLSTALGASERAARLCRQLLGFARKQVITPQIVDLNKLVLGFAKLLGRLLGEDVTFEVELETELWPVSVDPTQFEQVLASLAVNARDAMPGGGRLRIETRNLDPDELRARRAPDVERGDYVMLSVADTGSGIPVEDRAHVFEPFFTTKALASGSGLGLATVHGAVKQNGGHIWVESELGRGTSFTILLPRARALDDESETSAELTEASDDRRAGDSRGGNEAVLVVEDEAMVRRLTVRVLLDAGYRVLEAKEPLEALLLVDALDGRLDLCVTDVVMPNMSGKQLADELARRRPDTPVLFVSGYTRDTIVKRGVLEPGVAYLAKPFTEAQLLARVRERLDGA